MEGGPPVFPPGFTCPAVLWIQPADFAFRLRDSHSLWCVFPYASASLPLLFVVHTPTVLLPLVWPLPLSLATTQGISVDFFSSPYLDVSVQAVPPIHLWIQCMVTGLYSGRVSPFGYPRIDACFRLPVAFRRSLRPSSAPSAKAFSLRSSSLDLLMLESSQVLTSIPL